ncbi:hypothetical protein INT80_04250 [Gallibacterium anatis]|uniref:Uncharacterized protein n=1 Tax=Gallibacterium anatis TaxID=750 RepID=A0A930Y4W6_9PAST|nr:hypothetical protein [Gallibacterium anatis]
MPSITTLLFGSAFTANHGVRAALLSAAKPVGAAGAVVSGTVVVTASEGCLTHLWLSLQPFHRCSVFA